MISFALCTFEAISDKLRCGVWSRGKSLTDAESVAAGPYIALSPHTHTRPRGGACSRLQGPGFYIWPSRAQAAAVN